MAVKDWTFDISKLALGKPLIPSTVGAPPSNPVNPTSAPTKPYDPFGAFKSPSLPSGSSTTAPTIGGLPLPIGNVSNPAVGPVPPVSLPPAPSLPQSVQSRMLPPVNTSIATPIPTSLQKGVMPVGTPSGTQVNTDVAMPAPGGAKTINTKTGEAFVDGKAVGTTAPKNTDVATPAPTSLAKGDINAKTGEAIKPKSAEPTQPAAPVAVSPFQDSFAKALAELKTIVTQDDPRYKAAVNQFITNSALMDQADRDMLKMQINQDPNLRGQGAGVALMQVLNRDQRFNLDQGIAQLSNANLDRIVNLQKYGLETGLKIAEVYNAQKKEAFTTLLNNGQFGAAASTLQSLFDEQFPGLGIKVDAETLKSRDPYTLNQMSSKLDFVKSLSGTNPQAALPIIQSMLSDPQFKDYFPAGMTAEQVMQSFVLGQVPQNLIQAEGVQKIINGLAATGQGFDETGSSYPELFRLMGRNAVTEGRKLSLESINTLRAAQGLPAFQKDAAGNIVDDQGNPLDDQDYTELAYRQDYQDRVAKASEKPWEAVYKQLLGTPGLGEKLLKPELYPGANDAVKKVLVGLSMGTNLFYQDPSTGLWSLDMSKANLSESNPELQPYFMNWPTAAFNPDGTVATFTPGGYVYGEIVNGKPILSTPEDEALDQAYFAYRNTGGTLPPNQWYFATQGGKTQPNEKNIPEQFKPKEDFQNVGTTLVKADGPATGVSTEPPKTIEDERTQLLTTLKPSQKPPEDMWTKQVTSKTSESLPGPLSVIPVRSEGTETYTAYWNPDTGKYERSPNDKYRILYQAEPYTGIEAKRSDGTTKSVGVNFG